MIRKILLGSLGVSLLAGCTTMKVQDFAAGSPAMTLDSYFPGHSTAYGMFIDRFGNVKKQFTVDCHSTWDGTTMVLDEHFTYVGGADGQPENREWRFHKTGPNQWAGTAGDIIGNAVGEQSGNAFHMTYATNLHSSGHVIGVSVSDWMFRQSQTVVLNHTTFSKLGVTLGDVQIAFVHD